MAKGKKHGDGGVVNIKPQKPIIYAIMGSGFLLGASAVVAIFGFIFFGIEYIWVRILMAIVFFFPMMMLGYMMGRSAGDRDFKIELQKLSVEEKQRSIVAVKPYMGAVYTSFFVGVVLLISIIGTAASVRWMQVLTAFIALPVSLFFYSVGVIPTESTVLDGTETMVNSIIWDWTSCIAVIIYVLLLAAVYTGGYFLHTNKLKTRRAQLMTEMYTVRR